VAKKTSVIAWWLTSTVLALSLKGERESERVRRSLSKRRWWPPRDRCIEKCAAERGNGIACGEKRVPKEVRRRRRRRRRRQGEIWFWMENQKRSRRERREEIFLRRTWESQERLLALLLLKEDAIKSLSHFPFLITMCPHLLSSFISREINDLICDLAVNSRTAILSLYESNKEIRISSPKVSPRMTGEKDGQARRERARERKRTRGEAQCLMKEREGERENRPLPPFLSGVNKSSQITERWRRERAREIERDY